MTFMMRIVNRWEILWWSLRSRRARNGVLLFETSRPGVPEGISSRGRNIFNSLAIAHRVGPLDALKCCGHALSVGHICTITLWRIIVFVSMQLYMSSVRCGALGYGCPNCKVLFTWSPLEPTNYQIHNIYAIFPSFIMAYESLCE